ncbi:MAG: hypothetical protein R3B70_30510 [Polyangiaceae bacterium]
MLRTPRAIVTSLFSLSLLALLGASCGGNVIVENCEAGLVSCGGQCVNLDTDPDNCGECGVDCGDDGVMCSGGVCGIGPGCPGGFASCNGVCADLSSDPQHCGGCDIQCAPGATCSNNACSAPGCTCGTLCSVTDLGSAVPQQVNQSFAGVPNTVTPSCASNGGADVSFSFTAPYDAVFWFDTFGSSSDTALQILGDNCQAIGCNDDYAVNGTSAVQVKLAATQKVFVTVEQLFGSGDFQLNIRDPNKGCSSCSEAVQDVAPFLPLCPQSEQAYTELVSCVCVGPCGPACSDLCNGGEANGSCADCLNTDACSPQINKCVSD